MAEARPSLVETSLEIELQDPRLVAELIAAVPVGLALGIDESLHPLLFQRFTPIETDTNRHLCGLGIGLYLVREVLAARGGRIQIESHPSTGTTALEVPR